MFHNDFFDTRNPRLQFEGAIKIENMIFIFVGPDICFNTSNSLLTYLTLYQK